MQSSIHQQLKGDEQNTELPEVTTSCLPGLCKQLPEMDAASRIARSLHNSLAERSIRTGSLLVISANDPEFSFHRSLFLGVTLKRPLLQTVVLANIQDDVVSMLKQPSSEMPQITTTCHLFVDMLRMAGSVTRVNIIDVEHWACKSFLDAEGKLHTNAESLLDSFSISCSKPSSSSTAKASKAPLPFGFKDVRKRKAHAHPAGSTDKKSKKDNPKTTNTLDLDASEPGSGSDSHSDNDQDQERETSALAESSEIEPITDVMQEELKKEKQIVKEIEQADVEKAQLEQSMSVDIDTGSKAQASTAKGQSQSKTFFSARLGLGAGSLAPTSRAICHNCRTKIGKNTVRFEWFWNRLKPNAWIHYFCVPEISSKFKLKDDTLTRLQEMLSESSDSSNRDVLDAIHRLCARMVE